MHAQGFKKTRVFAIRIAYTRYSQRIFENAFVFKTNLMGSRCASFPLPEDDDGVDDEVDDDGEDRRIPKPKNNVARRASRS